MPLLIASVTVITACSKRKPAQHVDAAAAGHPRGADEVCLPNRWCWENPRPTGNWLYAVNGTASDRAWAAGEGGTILRWDGERWSFDGRAPATILSLAASKNGEVWAAGNNGTLLRRTTSDWFVVSVGTTAPLRSVATDDTGEAWVVGDNGLSFRCHDDNCQRISTGMDSSLNAVWASGKTVWAAGDEGAVIRWNGERWLSMAPPERRPLLAIAGMSDDSLFFAGALELVRHWTGTWTRIKSLDCWVRRASVEAVRPATYSGAWAASASDVWLVGDACSPLRWNGRQWITYEQPLPPHVLSAVWGSTSNDVWAVGDAILHWDGSRWNEWGQPLRPDILAMSGATDALWALARGRADEKLPNGHDVVLRSMSGHWQTSIESKTPLFGIHANGVEAWVCGADGIVLHWDGVNWESLSVETKVNLRAVWGTSSDLWVAGEQGLLMRRHNGTWSRVEIEERQTLSALWGSSAGDVWLTAAAGAVFHWDGGSWRPFKLGPARGLSAVTGTAANDVWIAGDRTLLHWDGANWRSAEDIRLNVVGLCSGEAGDLWMVDDTGGLTHRRGEMSERIHPSTGTFNANALQSVYCHGRDVWVGGPKGTILRYQPDL